MTWQNELAVFDVETTGVDVETARIVTAYVGVINAHGETQRHSTWLIDPEIDIPAAAEAVHGISTERARSDGIPAASGVAQIRDALRELLENEIPVVIYNAPYDLTVLERESRRHGLSPLVSPQPIIDPLVIDKAVDTYRRGKRTLQVACEHYGVPLTNAHDSGADAIAAGHLAQALARTYPEQLGVTAHELHNQQVTWAAAQAANFEAYMRRTRDPEFRASGVWPVR